MISKKFSDSISAGGFICTIMVVAIHCNTLDKIGVNEVGFTFNYYVQEALTNGVSRVAVPYFALIAGFFFFFTVKNIKDVHSNIRKRCYTLAIPYVLTSTLILLSEGAYQYWFRGGTELFNSSTILTDIFLNPVPIQHWFLRDLLVLALLSPLIFFIRTHLIGMVVTVLFTLWFLDIEILPKLSGRYLIQIETLNFFVLGAFLSSRVELVETWLEKIDSRSITGIILLYTILLSVRIYIQPDFRNYYFDHYNLTTLIIQNSANVIGILLVFLLTYKIRCNWLTKISYYSFFIYLFHGLPTIRLVNKISDYFVIDAYKFYPNLALSVAVTLCLAYLSCKLAPDLYNLLTGGRGNKRRNHNA